MNDNVHRFPGVADSSLPAGVQPDPDVIAFCEDLLDRARAGAIQAIAVTLVKPGGYVADGWQRGAGPWHHQLMAGITYLQNRFASQVNERDEYDAPPQSGA